MAHSKVICAGEAVVCRGSYERCVAAVKMHKEAKSSKGSETSGAMKAYTIETDPSDYPLNISGAPSLGYTPTKKEIVKYKDGERPY